jgi:hypothetical protein
MVEDERRGDYIAALAATRDDRRELRDAKTATQPQKHRATTRLCVPVAVL